MTEVRVELFDTGSSRPTGRFARRSASWRRADLPAYAAAVVHPVHGALVVDTGYSQHFLDQTRSLPESLYLLATPLVLPFPPSLAKAKLSSLGSPRSAPPPSTAWTWTQKAISAKAR